MVAVARLMLKNETRMASVSALGWGLQHLPGEKAMARINSRSLARKAYRSLCLSLAIILALPALALAQPRHGHGRVHSLPHGYQRYHHGGRNYYYHGGHYYGRHAHGYYYRTRPPRGFFMAALPFAAAAVVLGGLTYYTYNGIYYQPSAGGYVVVDPPPGVVVSPAPMMAEPAPELASGAVAVIIPTLNVRSGPGANYPVVAIVNQGQQMGVRGIVAGWLNVQMPNGLWGWVAQKYTAPVNPLPNG
jgi:hypothetical protein